MGGNIKNHFPKNLRTYISITVILTFSLWTVSNVEPLLSSETVCLVVYDYACMILIKTCLHASLLYALDEHNNYLFETRSEQVTFSPSQHNDK